MRSKEELQSILSERAMKRKSIRKNQKIVAPENEHSKKFWRTKADDQSQHDKTIDDLSDFNFDEIN
jgi:hypothetical protein